MAERWADLPTWRVKVRAVRNQAVFEGGDELAGLLARWGGVFPVAALRRAGTMIASITPAPP